MCSYHFELFREIFDKTLTHNYGGVRVNDKAINNSCYAEDTVLLAENITHRNC